MFLVYLGIYTFILLMVWWFFIVAKIHAYKFKNFSYNIEKVTITLFIFLLVLSIIWYILIFFLDTSESWKQSLKWKTTSDNNEIYY